MTRRPSTRDKMVNLPNPAGGRSIPEWVGKTPDSKVPESVQLRIWRRQNGRCSITGQKMRSIKEAQLDHERALSFGGEHRESNLRWVATSQHKKKSSGETGRRAKADAVAKQDVGIGPAKQPIVSRGFAKREKQPKIAKATLPRRELYK